MNASEKLQHVKVLLSNIFSDTRHYQQMLIMLEQQRLTMIRRDSTGLEKLNEAILIGCQRLNDSAIQRRQVLMQLGLDADRLGIEAVSRWLPVAQKSAMVAQWKELERLVKRCRAVNEKNGELLTCQYEFVQRFLGVESSFLYGSSSS